MRLEKIEIEGLFQKYDYVIPLNTDERITIIHGLNGTGKTTILNLLQDFCSSDLFDKTQRFPYHILRLFFDDSYQINIYRTFFSLAGQSLKDENYDIFLTDEDIHKDKRLFLEIVSPHSNKRVYFYDGYYFFDYKYLPQKLNSLKIKEIKEIIRKDKQNFNLLLKISENYKQNDRQKSIEAKNYEEIRKVEEDISNIKYKIEKRERELQDLKLEYDKIYETYNDVIEASLQGSHLKDRIDEINKNLPSLKIEVTKLIDDRNKLAQTNSGEIFAKLIFPNGKDKPFNIRFFETSRLISLDSMTTEILGIIKNESIDRVFSKKITVFIDIIETFLHNKTIQINKKDGVLFFDKITKSKVIPEQLSSGEKHIIVIFGNLLFKTSDDCLVLIDEPELSLHISWQIRFIEKLKEVLAIDNMKNVHILIATHSPEIIHDRWDLTVEIGSLE